jgi:hypothetical protein
MPPRGGSGREPRSVWVYVLAAFGGTFAAIVFLGVLCFGGAWLLLNSAGNAYNSSSDLTYYNDTDALVRIYECIEDCKEDYWDYTLEPEEELTFSLYWYEDNGVEWVIVAQEDHSYACIFLPDQLDQMVLISTAKPCPPDIRSPEISLG